MKIHGETSRVIYNLADILYKCVINADYRQEAKPDVILLAKKYDIVRTSLERICKTEAPEIKGLIPLSTEILNSVNEQVKLEGKTSSNRSKL